MDEKSFVILRVLRGLWFFSSIVGVIDYGHPDAQMRYNF